MNTDKQELPAAIMNLLKSRETVSYLIDADFPAKLLGMIQASNMAVLGFFSRLAIGPYSTENIKKPSKKGCPGRCGTESRGIPSGMCLGRQPDEIPENIKSSTPSPHSDSSRTPPSTCTYPSITVRDTKLCDRNPINSSPSVVYFQ